ncbi:MAG: galactose mutarotase, partial [Muribaculaceae bacterium]|nr:galactose mutarotase [Muribaculaceae bacterium]
MKLIGYSALIAACACVCSCGSHKEDSMLTKSGLDPKNFETVVNGDSTSLVTLKNEAGMEVCITNYGGRIVSIMVPDKDGVMQDVVLGFDSVGAYLPDVNKTDFGAAIGRYANRINQGRFVLDGDTIQLPQNNFGHCLHGGTDMGTLGWQYRVYKIENVTDSTLKISIDSPDGDNQFPGNVKAYVTYTLQADNALRIDYEAETDKPTIINMTNHSYFNLSGDPELSVTDEMVWINADNYTPVDSTFMTTGEIVPVKDTPMDFTVEKLLGQDIESEFIQVKYGNGFDHNFVLNTKGNLEECAARVTDPRSGIVLEVFTNEPGIQFYT